MLPTRSYSLRIKPMPGEPTPVVDKRLPYMSISLDDPPIDLNGKLRFAAAHDSASRHRDEASDPEDDSEGDDRPAAKAPPEAQPLVVCRHMALKYCEHSIDTPTLHPRELFTRRLITAENPAYLDLVDLHTALFASHVHLLPSHRFGEFLSRAFEEMREEMFTQAPPTPDAPAEFWRVYYATTVYHAMGLRLRVKAWSHQSMEFVVNVYDPNTSTHQVSCRCENAQDFADNADDYDFLSFLIREDRREHEYALVMSYFPPDDPATHLQLYEMRDFHTPQKVPPSLATDWCSDPRVGLMYARCAEMGNEITRNLLALLQVDASQIGPADLMALPDADHSLLFYALYEEGPQALLAWERLWTAQPLNTRAALLDGRTMKGSHVLAGAEELSDEALLAWCRMAGTLPPDELRAAIAAAEVEGDPPLICALRQQKTRLLSLLIGLIDQATEGDPLQASQLLGACASDGSSALEVAMRHATQAVQETWLKRVKQLPRSLAATLLAGLDRQDDPLWLRLLAQRDEQALWALSAFYAEHMPTIANDPFVLAMPVRSSLRLPLFQHAREDIKRYGECAAAILRWLPEATISDLDCIGWT